MDYQIWYKTNNNSEWEENICFSFLRDEEFKDTLKSNFLYIRFNNRLDREHTNISTKEWIELFLPDIKDKIVRYSVRKYYFYVTIDLSKVSYEWIMSILTLFRYAGEYVTICEQTKYILDALNISNWDALFLAHQVYGEGLPNSYNFDHALFTSGNKLYQFSFNDVKERLNEFSNYIEGNTKDTIHAIWCNDFSYGPLILFKKEDYEQ
ncbi:MAG: hypothetical protein RBT52_02915 [Sulfurimonas sp.]|jgi:hypothetical protein|nr:hypothetical protein [Sulfurimonas sp.]